MAKTIEQVRRAYAVLDHIKQHPELHDQDSWIDAVPNMYLPFGAEEVTQCGTTACYAGWTVLLAGDKFIEAARVETADGTEERVSTRARELLGLTHHEGNELFYAAIDLREVERMIPVIFGPRPDGAA